MKKILIIDDESLVRRSLKRALQSRGYVVEEAEDGVEGFDKWIAFAPDLTFLDVLMPGCSGPQLLERLGAQKTGAVILMSAFSGEHNINTAQEIGADLFVAKPFEDIFKTVALAEQILNTEMNL